MTFTYFLLAFNVFTRKYKIIVYTLSIKWHCLRTQSFKFDTRSKPLFMHTRNFSRAI